METIQRIRNEPAGDDISLDFSTPRMEDHSVIVSIVMSDGTKHRIGRLYQEFDNGYEVVRYVLTNNNNREIFPPADEFQKAETLFLKYARWIKEQIQREDKLNKVRKNKNIPERTNAISR